MQYSNSRSLCKIGNRLATMKHAPSPSYVMRRWSSLLLFFSLVTRSAISSSTDQLVSEEEEECDASNLPNLIAPVAKKEPLELIEHNDTRIDNYFWMRLSDEQKNAESPDSQTQDVLDHLEAENLYKNQAMAHTEDLQEQLFQEMTSRLKQDDQSAPLRDNGYWYYSRFEEGKEYAINARKLAGNEKLFEDCVSEEQIMLDQNELADGLDYFKATGGKVSDDNNLYAFGIDTVGRRQYTIKIKDLVTGEMLPDQIELTTGRHTWAADNRHLFYTQRDPDTLRSYQVYRHRLLSKPPPVTIDDNINITKPASTSTTSETDAVQLQQEEGDEEESNIEEDVLVFEETDDTFSCYVGRTKSDAYLVILSFQTVSQEYRVLDASNPTADGDWMIVQPRERNLEYDLDHFDQHFYMVTNYRNATNFQLMRTPVNNTTKDNWEVVIPHRSDILLTGIEIFKDYLVIGERVEGLTQIRIKSWDDANNNDDADIDNEYLTFNDPAYTAETSTNPDIDTEVLRFSYNSMNTPRSTYSHNMRTGERILLKQQEVVDPTFSPDYYSSERLMVEVRDGVKVPVSMVYRKGIELNDGKNPFLLYGYGSYGSSLDPYFSSSRLSLLNRGFIFALAHVRGGQELGRSWYEDGKLLKKQNTFNDFEDVGRAMVEMGYTSPGHFYASGGSAGGLLMGAVMNQAPDLFNGILVSVPFVDVLNTMLDETIPLTTFEFDEWGNPKDIDYYYYMKSYSPYDQVSPQDYPNTLVTTGYWDSQVQYWEPMKWVAKLRELKTGDKALLLHTNMDAGHGGQSGRFRQYRELALEYAFIFDLEGMCVSSSSPIKTSDTESTSEGGSKTTPFIVLTLGFIASLLVLM